MKSLALRIIGAIIGCLGAGTLIGLTFVLSAAKITDGQIVDWKAWLAFLIGALLTGSSILCWHLAKRIDAWGKFEDFIGEIGEARIFPRMEHD